MAPTVALSPGRTTSEGGEGCVTAVVAPRGLKGAVEAEPTVQGPPATLPVARSSAEGTSAELLETDQPLLDAGAARSDEAGADSLDSKRQRGSASCRSSDLLPLGRRVFCDPCSSLTSRQSWAQEAFALVTVALYCGTVHLLLALGVASIFSRAALAVTCVLWATALLPARCLWPAFLNNALFRAWRRYFRYSVIVDGDIELRGRQYVIAEYPHGVFPLSQLIAVSLADMCWPGHDVYFIAADAVFRVPIFRHLISWAGGASATAASFKQLLGRGSVGLVPDGIAGMFASRDDAEVIKIKERKGFVRIAVEMGADILPCFHFGNSQLFRFGPRWLEPIARRHRIALGYLVGRWGLPLGIPNRVPLMMAIGSPVVVPRGLKPSDPGFAAAVDAVHAELVTAMVDLYHKHRAEYGWADRPLVVL